MSCYENSVISKVSIEWKKLHNLVPSCVLSYLVSTSEATSSLKIGTTIPSTFYPSEQG